MTELCEVISPSECNISFTSEGIIINGKPRIVLCSSVFYFRIPREEWRDRLKKVKTAGYNCIDVYFPWNYHETEEGHWDFEGERDLEAYLSLAAELGLWVIARPGPYICSEWDMGGLPAYLLAKEGIVLRDNNEIYLEYVKGWYNQIMPRLAKYQLGKQGTIIAVQIENELDFYNCQEIDLYMKKLREYALDAGIQVPMISCAGQCDIYRAGGLVKGLIPTLNLYPDISEKTLEDRVNHYVEVMREMKLPLCITETSTTHVILRRELIAGAKLIAAYNQVGGTNFGFTTAINNWGTPLSFLSHDYTLKSMINSQGEITQEYGEAFLLSGLIYSLEEGIACGSSCLEEDLQIVGDCNLSEGIHRTLRLSTGGKLAAIANIDEREGKVYFTYEGTQRPCYSEFIVAPSTCPILPFDLPLASIGLEQAKGRLAYSTAELVWLEKDEKQLNLLFHTDREAEIAIAPAGKVDIQLDGMECYKEKELLIFVFHKDRPSTAKLRWGEGFGLCLEGVSREQAILKLMEKRKERVEGKTNDHTGKQDVKQLLIDLKMSRNKLSSFIKEEDQTIQEELSESLGREKTMQQLMEGLQYHMVRLPNMGEALGDGLGRKEATCLPMENMGYYRGYGWYEGSVVLDQKEENLGYMIYGGMDILHLYRDYEYLDSYIGDGNHRFIPEPEQGKGKKLFLGVRSEIWGHSNFSDSRLPSLNLSSKKGIQGLAVITNITDLTESWWYCKGEKPANTVGLLTEEDKFRPIIRLGVYNNPEQPQVGVYKKKIKLLTGCNSMVLEIKNFNSYGRVYVDGSFISQLQPFSSCVTLDNFSGKEEIELAIYLYQRTIQESTMVKLLLYQGKHIRDINTTGADEKQLKRFTNKLNQYRENTTLMALKDIILKPGELSVLFSDFQLSNSQRKGIRLSFIGRDAKVLVLLNGRVIGRLWLPMDNLRPTFKGGDDRFLYLPGEFFKEENQLVLLVEAMKGVPKVEQIKCSYPDTVCLE